jgi:hypothetical protein
MAVVVLTPLLDNHAGLGHGGKHFLVQAFLPKRTIEPLAERILPRAGEVDVVGLHALRLQPFDEVVGDELRPVIAPDPLGHDAAFLEDTRQDLAYLLGGQAPSDFDRQGLSCTFIDQREQT